MSKTENAIKGITNSLPEKEKSLWKIMRENKESHERLFLSQKFKRWIPGNGKHRVAKVTEQWADEFLERMQTNPEPKYYYFKVIT